jgi:hypothetical protein
VVVVHDRRGEEAPGVPRRRGAGRHVHVVVAERRPRAEVGVEAADGVENLAPQRHIRALHHARAHELARTQPLRLRADADGDREVVRVVEQDAAGGVPDRRIVEHLRHPVEEVGGRVAVVVGEHEDPTTRGRRAGVPRAPEPVARLVDERDGEGGRAGELLQDGGRAVARRVVDEDELPAPRPAQLQHRVQAPGKAIRPVAGADDERDLDPLRADARHWPLSGARPAARPPARRGQLRSRTDPRTGSASRGSAERCPRTVARRPRPP